MEAANQLEDWHDLYVMLGTSAAALIGLLFVVTSLHLDEIMNSEAFRIRARNMTFHLLALLVEATLILTPQPIPVLGAELVAINLLGLQLPLSFVYKAFYKNKQMRKREAYSIYRGIINIAGYVLGIAGGASLIERSNLGMYLITASFIAFLVSAILNSWTIMTVVGQTAKQK